MVRRLCFRIDEACRPELRERHAGVQRAALVEHLIGAARPLTTTRQSNAATPPIAFVCVRMLVVQLSVSALYHAGRSRSAFMLFT
jgi:hypothetical protein